MQLYLVMGAEMKILVDGDACPVIEYVEMAAKEFNIEVILFCDTSHMLTSDYSKVITIDSGADAVDFAIMNICKKDDIVVTQDYGVAAMVLGKGAQAIHQSGIIYTNENIDLMLLERHLAREARMLSGKHYIKGHKKRTSKDNARFLEEFRRLISCRPA